jgi:hypothetical protein
MGAASSFKNRIENCSNGITDLPGVEHMGDMTPFQKQVIDEAERYEAKKKEEAKEEARNGNSGASPPQNSRAQGGSSGDSDMGHEETVRYVNQDLNPDHKVHDSE